MNIPFAIQYKNKMRERGPYSGGRGPLGMVIHTTDGRFEKGLKDAYRCIDGGIENGYTYLCASRDGELVQAHDIMKWGSHCGESKGLLKIGKSFVMKDTNSDELIGYEQCNAGMLTRLGDEYFPWWAFNGKKLLKNVTPIPAEDVRYISSEMAKTWGVPNGYYHKLSQSQENTLIKTIMWLYVNIEPFKLENVVGHHECSGLKGLGYWRKVDPGACLSMPMDMFRKYLIDNKDTLIIRHGVKKEISP